MTDKTVLSGPSVPPVSGGAPRQLVILLHGLGADGQDLISLSPHWGRLLPDAAFVAPNAPERCDMSPYGYQWFSLRDLSPERILRDVRSVAPVLDAFIDASLAEHGLQPENLALVGFSQGTMMALHVALRRDRPIAGIVGYSGALLAPGLLAGEIKSRPPVLLVHGDADQVVPFQAMAGAVSALEAAEVPVEAEPRPGLVHSIDMEGLARGGDFLRRVLAPST